MPLDDSSILGFAPYETAGPRALSLAPPFRVGRAAPRQTDPDWPAIYQHLEGRRTALLRWRYSWWQHWAQLAQFILPYRYHWVVTANTYNRGFPVNDSIINNAATIAMRICAAGLLSGLMSPSRPWFRLDPAVATDQVSARGRMWLDEVAARTLAVLAGSNWYAAGAQMFQDVATFGTSPLIIYEDWEDVVRCYVPCAGEYFLACGGRLSVDTLYREFYFSSSQLIDFFGFDALPEEVLSMWREGGGAADREYIVGHAIEPNFDLTDRGSMRKIEVVPHHFTWREVYWLRGREASGPLSLRGFVDKPFMAARWSVTSNDAYGRGPGMDALGDTKQLQTEERRKGEYIDKIVRPPMVGDVSLENKPSSILPGEITYVNAQDGKQQFYPAFEVNPQGIEPLFKDIESVEGRINRAFFTDIFLMISQMEGIQPRNEMELAQRIGEKIQMLGPVIELFEQEVAPAINRVITVMHRRGLLPPPPDELRGRPLGITYTSMMKIAQRAGETATMERFAGTMGSLQEAALSAQMPSPMRLVNLDAFAREYADRLLVPAKILYSPEQVAQQDEARSQAAQAQQYGAAALPAVQAAQGLSKIPVGGGLSALDAALGTRGGTGAG